MGETTEQSKNKVYSHSFCQYKSYFYFLSFFMVDAARLSTAWHLMAWRNLVRLGADIDQAMDDKLYWSMHAALALLTFLHTAAHFSKPKYFNYTVWSRLSAWWVGVSSVSNGCIILFSLIHPPVEKANDAIPWLASCYAFSVCSSLYNYVYPNEVAIIVPTFLYALRHQSGTGLAIVNALREGAPSAQKKRRRSSVSNMANAVTRRFKDNYFNRRIAQNWSREVPKGKPAKYIFHAKVFLEVLMYAAKSGTVAVLLYELLEVAFKALKENRSVGIVATYILFGVLGFAAKLEMRYGHDCCKRRPLFAVVAVYGFLTTALFCSNLYYGLYALVNNVIISDEIDAGRLNLNFFYSVFTVLLSLSVSFASTRMIQFTNKTLGPSLRRARQVSRMQGAQTNSGEEMQHYSNPMTGQKGIQSCAI